MHNRLTIVHTLLPHAMLRAHNPVLAPVIHATGGHATIHRASLPVSTRAMTPHAHPRVIQHALIGHASTVRAVLVKCVNND